MKTKTVYLDRNGNFTTPEKAHFIVEHTYDDAGRLIQEDWILPKIKRKK